MIVGIHDLENHFFVGAIETKMPIINYDAVKKEIIHRIFCCEKQQLLALSIIVTIHLVLLSIGSSFSWSYMD